MRLFTLERTEQILKLLREISELDLLCFAGKHTQNILTRVNKQQEVDELTSRIVEISLSQPPANSPEDTLEDSDIETTVLDYKGVLLEL